MPRTAKRTPARPSRIGDRGGAPVRDVGVLHLLREDPRGVRAALLGVLVLAAVLYLYDIGHSGLSTYYAAAARSMAADPRAFLFGALNPGATLTLDKLSGFLVPQAIAIDLFGFHPWALSLPQAVEGLVTVFTGYVIGRRWRGAGCGLAIAGVLATTPMLAAMFGRPMEDGMLTMCEVLAFAALQRSLHTQRLRWLVLAGAWIAVGFQAKMLQSWLLLPALVIASLLGGRAPMRTRLAHVAIACAVCVLLSVSWMTVIQLVPAGARPYVDGTTNDDVFSMVFGYNGVDRLLPGSIPGAVPQLNGSGTAHVLANRTRTAASGSSVVKVLLPQITTQIGWLYPAALAGIAAAVVDGRRVIARSRPMGAVGRTRLATEAGLLTWLAVAVGVLSLAFVPHATYFAVVALPLAAFAVHGAFRALEAYRAGSRLPLPVLIAAQGVWAAAIIAQTVPQLRLLAPVPALLAVAAAALLLRRGRSGPNRLRTTALAAGLVAALLGPVVWSSFVLGSGGGGSASDAFAGPRIGTVRPVPLVAFGGRPALIHLHRPFSRLGPFRLTPAQRHLLHYVDARNRPGAIAFAGDSLPVVVSVVLGSSASPLPMGGFSKQATEPSLPALFGLVRSGRLRFVLLQDRVAADAAPENPALEADRAWVLARCPARLSGRFREGSTETQTLYDCGAVVAAAYRR